MIKLLISDDELDNLRLIDLVPFICTNCKKEAYRNKELIQRSIKMGYNLYCGAYCRGVSKERREKQSQSLKKFLKEHPNHPLLKFSGSSYSLPCEFLKNELKNRNIPFQEEILPLLHKNIFYRVDILLEQYGAIIEVNGGQHFKDKEKYILTNYFQKRHDLLENEGWKVFEIPAQWVMHKGFIDKLIIQIQDIKNKYINLDYKPLNKKTFCQCGKKLYNAKKRCLPCWKKFRKKDCPVSKGVFHWYLWNCFKNELKRLFHASWDTLDLWIKNFNIIEIPTKKYRKDIFLGKITDYQI